MFGHPGNFTRRVLLGALCLFGFGPSSFAAGASPPNFAPDPSAGWFAYSRQWIAPKTGAGPVRQDPAHPLVSNDEFRATGKQPTFPMGDPDSPILKPWARDAIRKRNETILSGTPVFSMHASCWPMGPLSFLLTPMTLPMYIVQGPKEVVLILESFNDVRRIYLSDKHSQNLKPSWYGDSIGRYEGDTLVVDTVGFNGKIFLDQYETPTTPELHVVERFHLVDGGQTLEVNVHVEDPGTFTMPWNAIQRFRRYEETVSKADISKLAVLATPEQGPLMEQICAENPNSFQGLLPARPVPQTVVPDF
jgi:hypothetical protein